jgi:hypothetical protein
MGIHELYRPFLVSFRRKRLASLYRDLRITGQTRLLDLGGDSFFWELAASIGLPVPCVTVVNLYPSRNQLPPGVRWVVADGTRLPFRDCEFDVAFSNSVIEHLGNEGAQECFAREARRVARSLFVQTPSRSFPVEPHLISPFIHWLPRWMQSGLLRNFTVWGLVTRPSQDYCDRFLSEVRLLDADQMGKLFPGVAIRRERWMGITKSLIAEDLPSTAQSRPASSKC